MPWGPAPTFQLIIPSTAGPNDARIEVGADMPADLVAKYGGLGDPETIVGGIVFYKGTATQAYFYLILTRSAGLSTRLCIGGRTESTLEIGEYFNIQVFNSGGFSITWGRFSDALATLMETTIINNNLTFEDDTFSPQLIMSDNTSILMHDNASMTWIDTSIFYMFVGAIMRWFDGAELEYDGFSMGRGPRPRVDSATGTAAVAAETVALTTPNITFRNGRAYRVRWATDQVSSVANVVAFRVRRTGIAGTVVYLAQFPVPTGAGAQHRKSDEFYLKNSSGADVTDVLVLTHRPSAGTTTGIGSATQVRYLEAEDCGEAGEYPNAFAIV